MTIDNCQYSFDELASQVLPNHFERLRLSIAAPLPATMFKGYKTASRELLARVGRKSDFPGCYVFIDREEPIYVGISRTVVKRLTQHLNQDSHYSASLVYRMACNEYPHELRRNEAMKDEQFRAAFFGAQERLCAMSVAFVEIQNDLELYLFEIYAAMQLDTGTWNTFRTH